MRMSDRVSGNPGRARRPYRVALVLGLVATVAGPLAPLAAAAGGVTVTTPFPAIVAEPGDTASFALAIDVDTARTVELAVEGVPSGWTARFRGGGLVIDGAFVRPDAEPEITLDVEIPDDAAAGTSSLRVTATGGGGNDELTLAVRVAEAAAGDVSLTSDFPELRGAADTEFTFNLTLANDTAAETTFAMEAVGQPGWEVTARPAGQAQATSLSVNAGSTGSVTVTATPPADVEAGTYPIQVTAAGGGETATIDLAVTVTGTYTLTLSTPDQVLSTTANAGTAKDFQLTLTNSGSAPVADVELTADAPTGWEVTFEPATVAAAAPGTPVNVTARITPSTDAIAGDYEMTIRATGTEANDDVAIRVRVETPQLWWIVGVGLILLTFAGLYWVFRTYGRR
jgi:uncharacterized membrane protein